MIKKIINIGILIIILGFIILTFGLKLLGYKYYSVISDSMYPSIPKYSLVYIKPLSEIEAKESIKVGDVIAINNGDIPLMHRVIEIQDNFVITHGDNNSEGVNETSPYAKIIGVVSFSIPYLGLLFGNVYVWIILALMLIIIIIIEQLVKELKKK